MKKSLSLVKSEENTSKAGNGIGRTGDTFRHAPPFDETRFMDGQLQGDLRPFTFISK
jgi:hypothetical protein